MLALLRKHAGWFVLAGWLSLLAAIPICLAINVAASIDAFYHPAHRLAPLDRFDAEASQLALAASVLAATMASIAIALKFRAAASILIIGFWTAILFCTPAARLFVKPGPEYFERHLNTEAFSVPWQYAPAGIGSTKQDPQAVSFEVRLCLSDLKGSYDEGCSRSEGINVLPRNRVDLDFDVHFWRSRTSQMRPEPEREGYQSYAYESTLPAGGPVRLRHYLVLNDSEGQLARLVVCQDGQQICIHHAAAGAYWFTYAAPLTEGGGMERRLAGLLDSWRVR